jgi:hypothetical protein
VVALAKSGLSLNVASFRARAGVARASVPSPELRIAVLNSSAFRALQSSLSSLCYANPYLCATGLPPLIFFVRAQTIRNGALGQAWETSEGHI